MTIVLRWNIELGDNYIHIPTNKAVYQNVAGTKCVRGYYAVHQISGLSALNLSTECQRQTK